MRLTIRGEYASDWPEIATKARLDAGHRCIRCHHRFVPKRDAKALAIDPSPGQWSPCDARCTHTGPIRYWNGGLTAGLWRETTAQRPVGEMVNDREIIEAEWRVLTVHHLTGDKSNNRWWNLLVLCQVCHLYVQGKVIPERPWLFEHSEWFKPYVAGFYASFYGGQEITRAEAYADLARWLALNPVGAA